MEIRRTDGEVPTDALAVRRAVFIDEQGVLEERELDGKDTESTHLVAYDDGEPIGTARFREYGYDGEARRTGRTDREWTAESEGMPGSGGTPGSEVTAESEGTPGSEGTLKTERVAVVADRRGEGIGRELMVAVERAVAAAGYDRIVLHAQIPVIGFYESLGYDTVGDRFEEAGIPHRRMTKVL